jgi:polysaccharide biosynthesis transport protein
VTLTDYLHVLRKRWRSVVVCALVVVGLSGAFVWHATPKYRASAQLFVAAKGSGSGASSLAEGGQFTQQRVLSYADIIDSPQLTGPVADALHDGLTADQIAGEVSANAPLNTVLLDVNVTDTSATRAQALANAVSERFAAYAAQLETTPGSATSPVKVTVVKYARLPQAPVSPKTSIDLALGLIVGLALGVGVAVLRETLDNTIRTTDDLQRLAGSGAIGIIPYDADAKNHPLVVAQGVHPGRSESFRQLRTNLQFVDVDRPPRSIVFTSSVPNEGKSTTVCNLAITMAQAELKVLVIEADLRRPRACSYLGLTDDVGLTSVLIGAAKIEDVVQQWHDDLPLHVLPAGPTPPNPSELLASRGMADLLEELQSSYDMLLLDSPPLLPVTDGAVIASQADGAVVVVRYGKTRREQLQRSVEALEGVSARMLGCVINMAPHRGRDAYHYGYAYDYAPRKVSPTAST